MDSEANRLARAADYDKKARQAGNAKQVVRKIHRVGKGIKSFVGIPKVEKEDWKKDVHKILICDVREEIAACGVQYCTTASSHSKGRYESFSLKESENAEGETAHARTVLTFIMLFASILRYENIFDSPSKSELSAA